MPLTLLDIAKRSGSDPVVGLIEESLPIAPEFRTIPVRTIPGTTYRATIRSGRPGSGFRAANAGVTPGNSKYEQRLVESYFMDCQLQVDEAIVKADPANIGSILADEGLGAVQGSFATIGKQVYDGISADAKGFGGLFANVDSTMVVDAAGTGSTCHTAWFLYENERDGVHFILGNNGQLSLGEWVKQQVVDSKDSAKVLMAYVNNLSAYLGLSIAKKYSIGCVKNITSAKPMTDALASQLVSKFPVGAKPTRCFLSGDAKFYLQSARTATINQKDSGRGDAFASEPTAVAGIPIVETDSIATRAAV